MPKHNPANVRVKRDYFIYLKEAKGQSPASVDAAAAALARFETYTRNKDFKTFCGKQAVAFKLWLADQRHELTGKPLSQSTLYATLSHLKRFFLWLVAQPGYRSRFTYADAEYLNLSAKESRIATARRERPVPTLEQLRHVIARMPTETEIELRNRALLAFSVLTGARDSAVASAKLKHVDLVVGVFYQDARDVKTKFSKTFTTSFFPVDVIYREIFSEWVDYLREKKLWGSNDPLFPKSASPVGAATSAQANEVLREHWATAAPIRSIFRQSFESAGLPYYNPHSLRHLLAQLGEKLCQTPEQFKAWSQNLGHESVLTTMLTYGTVPSGRQREIMKMLSQPPM